MRDPYTPGSGVMPPLPVGRERHLRRAQSELMRIASTGDPTPHVTAYVGARGMGKTVMLNRVITLARDHGFATAHVGIASQGTLVQDLAQAVGQAVAPYRGSEQWGKWGSHLLERLSQFSVEISAGGIAKLSARWDAPAAHVAGASNQLCALIVEAAQLVRAGGGSGLILSLDELQDAPESELGQVAHGLQEATKQGAPLGVYTAGLAHTPDVLTKAASFTERFRFSPFHKLDDNLAQLALLGPAEAVGVSWDAAAVDLAVAQSGGSPYLLQLHGSEAWIAADPTPASPQIRVEHVRQALEEARDSLHHGLFRGRWNNASPGEQMFLTAMAIHLDPATGSALTSSVVRELETTRQAISVPRQRLIDKGLIEATGRGELGFTMPGFEEYVLAQTTDRSTNRTRDDVESSQNKPRREARSHERE